MFIRSVQFWPAVQGLEAQLIIEQELPTVATFGTFTEEEM